MREMESRYNILCDHTKDFVMKNSDSKLKIKLYQFNNPARYLHSCDKYETMTEKCYSEAINFFNYVKISGIPNTQKLEYPPKILLLPRFLNCVRFSKDDFLHLLIHRIKNSNCCLSTGIKNFKKCVENESPKRWKCFPSFVETRNNYLVNLVNVLQKYPYIYYPVIIIHCYYNHRFSRRTLSHKELAKHIESIFGFDLDNFSICSKLYHAIMIYTDNKNSLDISESLFKPKTVEMDFRGLLLDCRTLNEISK